MGQVQPEDTPTISAAERRREPRFPSEESAVVTILASGKVVEATTVDISKSGLRVRAPEPVEVGTRLRINFGTTVAFGSVRWCRQVAGAGQDIGILVEHTLSESLVSSVHKALERIRNGGSTPETAA